MLLTPITVPTLITRAGPGTGQHDWFVLTNEEVEYIKNHIASYRVVEIPNGNHYTIILSEVFTREDLMLQRSITKDESHLLIIKPMFVPTQTAQ